MVCDSTQAPHYARNALANLYDMPEDDVRLIAPPDVGGGFGATPTPAIRTFLRPNAANAPVSAANDNAAGSSRLPLNHPGERLWSGR